MVLFINACVRKDSRTKRLADHLLKTLGEPYDELRLTECSFPAADEAFLNKRDSLIAHGEFSDPMFGYARQFAEADEIVIAAPFWDLSFPAVLKTYFEQINVIGLTFGYTSEGVPVGLCKAKKLCYVTTSGGTFFPESFGFGYVKALAETFYGIGDCELIKATGLDIIDADVDEILLDCKAEITDRFGANRITVQATKGNNK